MNELTPSQTSSEILPPTSLEANEKSFPSGKVRRQKKIPKTHEKTREGLIKLTTAMSASLRAVKKYIEQQCRGLNIEDFRWMIKVALESYGEKIVENKINWYNRTIDPNEAEIRRAIDQVAELKDKLPVIPEEREIKLKLDLEDHRKLESLTERLNINLGGSNKHQRNVLEEIWLEGGMLASLRVFGLIEEEGS